VGQAILLWLARRRYGVSRNFYFNFRAGR